ncbi:hypothetical protein [Gemella cuniculi]|uniref:hypothetical protein n=1 Tax=Gemella cuniculi TaxID=150240 RepID=UPI0003F4D4DB|nr:hypothetical protein [Gemella cuniculi]
MNKNTLLTLAAAGACAAVVSRALSKKEKFTAEELEKINKYKEYLEDKDYVIINKENYKKNNSKLLSLSSIPIYYKAAKTVAKFIF